jgi:hypothetical protein
MKYNYKLLLFLFTTLILSPSLVNADLFGLSASCDSSALTIKRHNITSGTSTTLNSGTSCTGVSSASSVDTVKGLFYIEQGDGSINVYDYVNDSITTTDAYSGATRYVIPYEAKSVDGHVEEIIVNTTDSDSVAVTKIKTKALIDSAGAVVIKNTTDSDSVAATKIGTKNIVDNAGNTMIKVTADGATHIGKNSLVTIEQNGKQSLYATDASGNKIDIDVNNGSNLLINGVNVVDKINGSVAMGAALSSLPKSPDGTTTLCGLGAGYHDESIAISYGCSMDAKNFTSSKSRIFKNATLNFGSSIAYNKNNNFSQLALSGGISWPLGKSSNNNIYSDKQESKIDSLNKEVAELRALIAEINSKLN